MTGKGNVGKAPNSVHHTSSTSATHLVNKTSHHKLAKLPGHLTTSSPTILSFAHATPATLVSLLVLGSCLISRCMYLLLPLPGALFVQIIYITSSLQVIIQMSSSRFSPLYLPPQTHTATPHFSSLLYFSP